MTEPDASRTFESIFLPYEPPVRQRFRHNYWLHAGLFLLTLATSTWVGASHYLGMLISTGQFPAHGMSVWKALAGGFWFSIPLLVFLGSHEFGHYIYCRKHRVDATLPYFIPFWLPFFPQLTGTLGAVIRIKEAFPDKRALFDIGVAGPIAGFIALIPLLIVGIAKSSVVHFPPSADVVYFGEPLLYKAIAHLWFGNLPAGADVDLHPMGLAAWWGMLATALNLMPFGQLDGGHIIYSLFGRRSAYVSIATVVTACLLTILSLSWISVTLMMLVMAMFLGVRHPRIADEDTPLDPGRRLIAACALVIFILCFTPVPIQTFFPGK